MNELNNAYKRYDAWNRALYAFYFDKESQDVVLYVDDDVLNEVGANNPLIKEDLKGKTYPEHFIDSTCIKRSDRIYFPKLTSDRRDDLSLYNLVLRSTQFRPKPGKIECLAFAVLMIYLYQKGRTEIEIRQYFNSKIGNEGFTFTIIDVLWKSIAICDRRFASESLADGAKQPYVGRLKYHLVLSRKYTKAFLEVLTAHQLRWDEQQESFSSFINYKVWKYFSKDQLNVIGTALQDSTKRPFFETLVRHCDYSSIPVINTEVKRDLLFVYKTGWSSDVFFDSLYLRSDEPNPIYFTRSGETNILVDFEDIVFHCNVRPVSFETEVKDIKYATLRRQYILLKKIGEDVYEEVFEPESGHEYIFVSKGDLSLIQNQTSTSVQLPVFSPLSSFYIQSWRQNTQSKKDCAFGAILMV